MICDAYGQWVVVAWSEFLSLRFTYFLCTKSNSAYVESQMYFYMSVCVCVCVCVCVRVRARTDVYVCVHLCVGIW